jgi:hypothetical protein
MDIPTSNCGQSLNVQIEAHLYLRRNGELVDTVKDRVDVSF